MNILQQLEQLNALLRDVSPLLRDYKVQLKKEGFTEQQAFDLVRDYQKILFSTESQ